jgi:hypothetical protein
MAAHGCGAYTNRQLVAMGPQHRQAVHLLLISVMPYKLTHTPMQHKLSHNVAGRIGYLLQ